MIWIHIIVTLFHQWQILMEIFKQKRKNYQKFKKMFQMKAMIVKIQNNKSMIIFKVDLKKIKILKIYQFLVNLKTLQQLQKNNKKRRRKKKKNLNFSY